MLRKLTFATALILSGCAAPGGSPPPAAAPSAAPATPAAAAPATPGSYDGLYRTTSSSAVERFGGAKSRCNLLNKPDGLRVAGATGRIRWRSNMTGTVGPAGDVKLTGTGDDSTLTGQITGTTFSGTMTSPYCIYTVTMEKS